MLVVTKLNFAQSVRAPFFLVTLCQTTPYWFLARVGNIVPIFSRCWGECCDFPFLPRSSWDFHLGVDNDWRFNFLGLNFKCNLHFLLSQTSTSTHFHTWGCRNVNPICLRNHTTENCSPAPPAVRENHHSTFLKRWDFNLWWETAADIWHAQNVINTPDVCWSWVWCGSAHSVY